MTPHGSNSTRGWEGIGRTDDYASLPIRVAVTGTPCLFVDVLIDALLASGYTASWVASSLLGQFGQHNADVVLFYPGAARRRTASQDLIERAADRGVRVIVLDGDPADSEFEVMAVDPSTTGLEELIAAIRRVTSVVTESSNLTMPWDGGGGDDTANRGGRPAGA